MTEPLSWYDEPEAPYFNRLLTLEEHTGTHMDAPAHFIPPPAPTTERVALDRLVGPAAVIEVGDLAVGGDAGCSPRVEAERVEDWERKHGLLVPEDIVLLRTGWSDRHYRRLPEGDRYAKRPVVDRDVPAWPALSRQALMLIADRGVTVIGADCPSVGALDEIETMHRDGLGRGLVFIENLIGLHRLPPRGALFVFLPLKLHGGSGAPGRAVAFLDAAVARPVRA
jgi:isatin hydrolase